MESRQLIVGDLRPEDELMHRATADPSFNESMMFNVFDTEQELGGFVRIGNRVNEGHAEMTFCVFLPGGELLMQWGKPIIDSNSTFDVSGMRFEVVEPTQRLHVTYRGPAVCIADPYQMREPGKAMRDNPTVPVELSLEVTNTGPMIGSASGNRYGAVVFLDSVGHYQQSIAAHGVLTAGTNRWALPSMFGARDHSWGPRVWHTIYRDRSIWITFGPDLAFICCKTWLDPSAPPDVMGCVINHGDVTPFRVVDLESHFRRDSHYHDHVQLELQDTRGRCYSLSGSVLSYVPLRHRAPGRETIFLGQAMTRFEFDGRRALGLSEFFDAESACPSLVELSRRGAVARE